MPITQLAIAADVPFLLSLLEFLNMAVGIRNERARKRTVESGPVNLIMMNSPRNQKSQLKRGTTYYLIFSIINIGSIAGREPYAGGSI